MQKTSRKYDVLFLANTTLRLQEEVSSAVDAQDGGLMAGNWGVWDLGVKIPQGEMEGSCCYIWNSR